ncbi:30293_t:CDS:2, partial [Gigaspora margarita]
RLWVLAIQEYKNDNRFKLWNKFLALYKAIKNPLTNAEKFKVDAQNWINLFLTPSSGKRNKNNFVKGLYNPSFSAFSCFGIEKKNYKQVSYFFSNTTKDGGSSETRQSAILNILEYENQALYFLYHNMEEPKFKKIKYY